MSGLFSEDLLDDVRSANSILDVVTEFLPLKKSGRNYKGLCPFHSEKTPSFMVNPERQIFHCFGCGEGGNVFGFVMKHQSLTFPEAVRFLAQRGGVSLPQNLPPRRRGEAMEKERLYEAQVAARDFFKANLKTPFGRKVEAYLQRRDVSDETVERFSVGCAQPLWDALGKTLVSKGFTEGVLAKGGLIVPRTQGGYIDRFRSRVVFPVSDLQGRVIAFGGRIVGEGEPKYLNSPETPLYNKSKTVYGLYEAREALRKEGFGVVVEGYFDLLTAHQAGLGNTVATSGTALTEGHLAVMGRYCDRWTVVFDGDAAGIRAAKRSLELFVAQGIFARGVLLPEGEDPDSFIRAQGAEAFRKLLDGAESLMEFFISRTAGEHGTGTVEGKVSAVREIVPLLAKVSGRVEQAEYVALAAHRLGVKEDVLWSEVRSGRRKDRGREASQTAARPPLQPRRAEEVGVVRAMVASAAVARKMREELRLEDLEDEGCRAVAAKVFRLLDEGAEERFAERMQFDDDVLNRLVASWLVDSAAHSGEETALKEAQDCAYRIRKRRVDRESHLLQEKINEAERAGNRDALHKLLRIKQELRLQAGAGS